MRKFTAIFSLLLALFGATNATADVQPVTADGIKDGRVIILLARSTTTNENFFGGQQASNAAYNAADNNFVVVAAEGEEGTFYLKKQSTGKYLPKAAASQGQTLTGLTDNTADAALFTAIVPTNITQGDLMTGYRDPTQLVRFVTTLSDGTTQTFLNCNNSHLTPKYAAGTGGFSAFCVYDAAEYISDGYLDNNTTPAFTYVGETHTSCAAEEAAAIRNALNAYSTSYSEANYNAVAEAVNSAEIRTITAEFDPDRFYLIEGAINGRDMFITVNDNLTLASTAQTQNASQIWKFEPADDNKYYLSAQGLYCGEAGSSSVSVQEGRDVSFYIVPDPANPTYFALDSEKDVLASSGDNHSHALHGANGPIMGWGSFADNSKWKLKYINTYGLTVGQAGWASLNLPFAVELAEGLTAYYATGDNGSVISLADAGKVIPANTPVIIEGTAAAYQLKLLNEAEALSGNKFKGTLLAAQPANPNATYALGLTDGEAKFLKLNTESATIAANKAYYEAPGDINPTGILSFGTGETTSIGTAVKNGNADSNVYYGLDGRRVLYPSKGIYVNAAGEKVFIK